MSPVSLQVGSATKWPGERIAVVVFGIYLAVALPVLVSLGSHYWFKGDEWNFLTGGRLSDPGVLFRSINSHWSTLPMLVYRALYNTFGLHSYFPFQLCLILLHLALCCLLRAIMRRAGVGPWVATISAAAFVLFGSGEVNIFFAVQISQVGSIVLAFTHLILADHDGRIDRRDWLGLLCGLMSIMSSGLGPPLVAVVGLAVIFRRGWRPALLHTLPLATVYLVWWISNQTISLADKTYPSLLRIWLWVLHGESGVFLALGGYPVVAMVLGALLVIGLILAWTPLSLATFRQRASLPVSMLIGALALLVVICIQRGFLGLDMARADRYTSVCTALTLPALAVAADAVVRRWRGMMPVVCALFFVGIWVNTTQFGTTRSRSPVVFDNAREALLAAAYSPLAEQAPADLKPIPYFMTGGDVDMAFLLEARNSGRLPPPPTMTPALKSQSELRLSLQQLTRPIPGLSDCDEHIEPIELHPEVGEYYEFMTPVQISLGESGAPLAYNAGWGAFPIIRILRPDLQLHLAPLRPAASFTLCSERQ